MNLAAMKQGTGHTRYSSSEQAVGGFASIDGGILKADRNQTYTLLSRTFTSPCYKKHSD
jgi:hypothetical protein